MINKPVRGTLVYAGQTRYIGAYIAAMAQWDGEGEVPSLEYKTTDELQSINLHFENHERESDRTLALRDGFEVLRHIVMCEVLVKYITYWTDKKTMQIVYQVRLIDGRPVERALCSVGVFDKRNSEYRNALERVAEWIDWIKGALRVHADSQTMESANDYLSDIMSSGIDFGKKDIYNKEGETVAFYEDEGPDLTPIEDIKKDIRESKKNRSNKEEIERNNPRKGRSINLDADIV